MPPAANADRLRSESVQPGAIDLFRATAMLVASLPHGLPMGLATAAQIAS